MFRSAEPAEGVFAAQARIVGVNAQYFLKNSGFFVISIKASCIDSTAPPEAVFAREIKKLQEIQLRPKEQVGCARAWPQVCCRHCCFGMLILTGYAGYS